MEAYVVESGGRASYAEGMNQNHARVCTSPEWAQPSVDEPVATGSPLADDATPPNPGAARG